MSRAVAIGDARRLAGYRLAGAEVRAARSAAEVETAWEDVRADAALLVLTPESRAALAPRLAERDDVVWVVVPS